MQKQSVSNLQEVTEVNVTYGIQTVPSSSQLYQASWRDARINALRCRESSRKLER